MGAQVLLRRLAVSMAALAGLTAASPLPFRDGTPVSFNGRRPACVSLSALLEAERAVLNHNVDWVKSVPGCVMPRAGIEGVVIGRESEWLIRVRVTDAAGRGLSLLTQDDGLAALDAPSGPAH